MSPLELESLAIWVVAGVALLVYLVAAGWGLYRLARPAPGPQLLDESGRPVVLRPLPGKRSGSVGGRTP